MIKVPLKFFDAPDVKKLTDEIIEKLELFHINPQAVFCYRSEGSKSKRIIARIHGFGAIWQKALGLPPSYTIEVISEQYDKLSNEKKEKTIIHELMHIPKGFKGGFRPHKGYVSTKQVEKMYNEYQKRKFKKLE
jgi:predicted metallopeptidase